MALAISKRGVAAKRSIWARAERKKTIRRTVIAVSILLLLLVGLGVAYTWYMGQQPLDDKANQPAPTVVQRQKPSVKTPDENAPVAIVQQTLTSPIKPPANASFSIKTNNGAACQISVKYNNVPSPDTGLSPKIADEFGVVMWSWSIAQGTLVGQWPIEVTCANKTHSAYYKATLEIVN